MTGEQDLPAVRALTLELAAPTLRVLVADVNPEAATLWLGRNTLNRPKKAEKIEKYARDMAAGGWLMTGEAIKFSPDGRLLDGQNRLHAVIRSGATIRTLVMLGVPTEAQDVMDSGAARSAADALAMKGLSNAKRAAAAARIALALEDGALTGSARYTHSEIQRWVVDNIDILDAGVILGPGARHLPLTPSVACYCAWRLARVSRDDAALFFHGLAEGVGLAAGSPLLALRRRLGGVYGSVRRISPEEQIAATFRAWNYWRKGATVSKIHTTGRAGTNIPEPI